jgi:hypothetical protein
MGAIELAGAEIGGKQRRDSPAGNAAEIAERIAPVLAGPIGKRGTGDDDRTHQVGMGGRQYHRCPAALAIAGDQRPRARRMAGVDFTQKSSLRRAHIGQRLAGHGLRIEDDEIHRVAVAQRDADLGFALEAADAAAVAGARIDDHPRPAILARRHRAFGRVNAHQRVVDRPLELTAVDDEVVIEGQYRREGFLLARDHRLAALAKRVEKKNPALGAIFCVFGKRIGGIRHQELRRQRRQRHCGFPCRVDLVTGDGLRVLQAPMAEQCGLIARISPVLSAGLQVALLVLRECRHTAHGFSPRCDSRRRCSECRR